VTTTIHAMQEFDTEEAMNTRIKELGLKPAEGME
jgi:hypothetical protein